MRLNLKSDLRRVMKYIQQRCRDYPVYLNAWPGKDEDAITLITLGYQYDQAGWVALVFDTRTQAEVDGAWQQYIAQNVEPFEDWTKAFDAVDDGKKLQLTGADCRTETLTSEEDLDTLGERIGQMCRDALLQCKQQGYFKKLPLSDQARLVVEDHDGGFGWVEENR
jgi:hypothetical protein